MYLLEAADPSDILEVRPIFDETVSPRNLCIVARRGRPPADASPTFSPAPSPPGRTPTLNVSG